MAKFNSEKRFDERKTKSSKRRTGDRKTRRPDSTTRPDPIDAPKDKDTYIHGNNDVNWLLHNPMMAEVASRVPFGRPSGYAFPDLFKVSDGLSGNRKRYVTPGIVTFPSLLTLGVATDSNSPINQAALALWVKLRQAGTGSLVDDPNDVALYFGSIAQLLAASGWMRRVLAELTAVNPLNRYVRQGLVYSEGLDYDDLVSHYSEFAFFVTWFTAQVNNFIFPKLDYFDQAYTAFHYIYKDENAAKAQCYMITPHSFGRFNPLYNNKGGAIVYGLGSTFTPGENISFSDLKDTMMALLSVLINDQATATLSAAVLKAYGESELWRLQDIDVLHTEVEIVMDAEILMQIHNIEVNTWMNAMWNIADISSVVYSSEIPEVETGLSPYLKLENKAYNIGTSMSQYEHYLSEYFDAFTEVPSQAEVLLMSRLKSPCKYTHLDGEDIIEIESMDAISVIAIFKVTLDSDGSFTSTEVEQTVEAIGRTVYRQYLTEFQFAPLLYNFGASDQQDELIGEIHNFVCVENRVIEDIHLNNLLSLFNVPIHR